MSKKPGKWITIISLLTGALVLFLSIAASTAEARSLDIIEVEIQAEILPEGDLKITEHRTVDFTGQYRGFEQTIDFAGIALYNQIIIREDNYYYRLVEDFPTFEPGTYSIKVFGADFFAVDWSFDALNEERTFTLEYIARDAVIAHNDVAELYYVFIGDGWDNPTGKVTVTLTLPGETSEEELFAWGHGPYHGEVEIVDSRTVTWTVSPLPANTFLEGRVVFPLHLVPEATDFSGKEAFPAILAEEKHSATQANIYRLAARYQPYYTLALLLIVIFILYKVWKKALNKKNAYKGEYYRQLPGTYPPEIAGYLWYRKKVRNEFLSAAILNLARQGYLRIEEFSPGGKKNQTDFRLVKLINSNTPLPIEKEVLDFLFDTVYQEYASNQEDGGESSESVAFTQVGAFARKKPRMFHSFYQSWQNALVTLGEKQQFYRKISFLKWGCLPLLAMFILSFFALFLWGLYMLAIALFLSPLVLAFASPRQGYTEYGADQLAKWKAFRRFLLHFSRLDRSSVPSISVWEHYLVYAVVLGVAKQVIDQLAIVFPNLHKESTISQTSWSALPAARGASMFNSINTMTSSLNTTVNSASRTAFRAIATASSARSSGSFSSRSGSSGGFSRGGSSSRGRSGGGGRAR
jgi:uncharacterized membrane protein